jgi:lysozyme
MIRSVVGLVTLHEGFRSHPYKCTADKWTVGIGRNIEANPIPGKPLAVLQKTGITREEAERLLIEDLQSCIRQLETINEFTTLDTVRRAALIDMTFNLGFRGLLGFRKMWAAIAARNFEEAANQAKDSRWYRQVKTRGVRVVEMIRSGRWPDK